MIVLPVMLMFVCVSTMAGLALGMVVGALTVWGVWLSLVLGTMAAIFTARSCRGLFPASGKIEILDAAAIFFFSLFSLRHFLWIYFFRDGMICTLNGRHNFSDITVHLAFIQNFVNGSKFWPLDPLVVDRTLNYHFGVDLFTAFFVKLGIPLENTLPLLGLTFSLLTMIALYLWGRGFAVAGFLFSGGIAGYLFFSTGSFEDYQAELAWKSLPLTLLVPQRSYLFGFPAGLLLLWSWRRRLLQNERGLPVFCEGLLWGMMPVFHTVTFMFLSVIFLVWSVARGKFKEALPVYYWAVLPAAFLILKLTGHFQLPSSMFWIKPGWMIENNHPLFFFFINFGFFPLVVFWALYAAIRARDADSLLVMVPPLILFVAGMYVMILPSDWDNIKIFVWSYLMVLPIVNLYVIRPLKFWVRIGVWVILFFSGFVCVFGSMKKDNRGGCFISLKEYDSVCFALKEGLPPNLRIAVAQDFQHPVSLCGYPVVAGWNGYLWSHGADVDKLQNQLRRLMDGEFDWMEMAHQLKVRYLFWGPREETAYPNSNKPWRAVALKLLAGEWGEVYDLQMPSGVLRRPGALLDKEENGLDALFFDNPEWSGTPLLAGKVNTLNLEWTEDTRPLAAPWGWVLEGEIFVPEKGPVVFYLSSDDGSSLEVNGVLLIDNLGIHAERVRSGASNFAPGWHPIRIRHNDFGGSAALRVWWQLPSASESEIPSECLRSRNPT